MNEWNCDVAIIGAGLAGLSLARHLLLEQPDVKIVHLEKRTQVPGPKQKVGESTVQVGGYYYSKILDLEEYLQSKHLMKNNLRFMWKTPGTNGGDYEDYSQGYIRNFSNIASYQLDRNRFEAELVALNTQDSRYTLLKGVSDVSVTLHEDKNHSITFSVKQERFDLSAKWIVDATGRKRLLSKQMNLKKAGSLSHGSSWFWIDGMVNIEKLTRASRKEQLNRKSRGQLGHLPLWLSTTHFMGDGFWLWVIVLQGRTSFGLVYDRQRVDAKDVNTSEKLLPWIIERFPLFKSAFEGKEIIDFTTLQNYTHDSIRTIHANRWAVTGEAGRFSDPLYSPGSDVIAIYNSLIVDAIASPDPKSLAAKTGLFESMEKVVYRSFLPSFSESYRALGDHECFFLKYSWELSIYFVYYVFPFINHLFTDRGFLGGWFRRFSEMGAVNKAVLAYVTQYFLWKKDQVADPIDPAYTDFITFPALMKAEKAFYQTGLTPGEALAHLDEQNTSLMEAAKFIMAYIDACVLGDPRLCDNPAYVAQIEPQTRVFDLEAMRQQQREAGNCEGSPWSFCSQFIRRHFKSKSLETV